MQGGRWKPLHYWYKKSLFTRVFATCGSGGNCMVKNDHFEALTGASLSVSKIELSTGAVTSVYSEPALSLPAGPGAASFFTIDATIDGSAYVLRAVVTNASGAVLTDNLIPLLPPANWTGLPKATVTFAIAPAPNADGSIDITLTSDGTAAYVVLTSLAQGRFSDNAFMMLPSAPATVQYIPFYSADFDLLSSTLRVEHMRSYQ